MTTPVLVAGATGDPGACIVRELLRLDNHVRVLTRPGNSQAARLYGENPRIEIVESHYTDPASLANAGRFSGR